MRLLAISHKWGGKGGEGLNKNQRVVEINWTLLMAGRVLASYITSSLRKKVLEAFGRRRRSQSDFSSLDQLLTTPAC